MGRITGPVCRLCRRDGLKLFLKGSRCDTPKCAFERRATPPGMVQKRRSKATDYGLRLREKQKVKHYYGVLERQFRTYFARAVRGKGNTGETRMTLLERRFAASRAAARQLVLHGHITVNGRRVDVPSYLAKAGDLVRVKNRAKSLQLVHGALAEFRRDVPDFLSRGEAAIPEGRVDRLPAAEDVSIPVQANLIIELCSK
jgi:small subunit ribosomal protein S4